MKSKFPFSTFSTLTLCAGIVLACAAVALVGALYAAVESGFREAAREQGMRTLPVICRLGHENIDAHLHELVDDLKRQVRKDGVMLTSGIREVQKNILAAIRMEYGQKFFYIPEINAKPITEDTEDLFLPLAKEELSVAWRNEEYIFGPFYDAKHNYVFAILMPCVVHDATRGLLGTLVPASNLSSWIKHIDFIDGYGISFIMDAKGDLIATGQGISEWKVGAFNVFEVETRGEASGLVALYASSELEDSGIGKFIWQNRQEVYAAWQKLNNAPWTVFVGFDNTNLTRRVLEAANTALSSVIVYYYAVILAVLILLVIVLVDATRTRSLLRMLEKSNRTVTEQREDLAATERMFRYALEQSHYQVIDCNLQTLLLHHYVGVKKKSYGLSADSEGFTAFLCGMNLSVDSLTDIQTLFMRVTQDGQRNSCEFPENKESGDLVWYRLTLSGLVNDQGTIQRIIGVLEDISDAKEADYDPLTHLYNKIATEKKIRQSLDSLTPDSFYAFILLDLDFFKKVNDTLGHPVGDEVLRGTADVLCTTFRKDLDILGRIGGDEFCIFLSGEKLTYGRLKAAMDSISSRAHDILHDNDQVRISYSCGVIFGNRRPCSFDLLYSLADEALYRVKEAGRDNYEIMEWCQ